MRRLIEIATERRVTIVMFTVAIIMFGSVSLSKLKLNLLPDLSYPTITIRTDLPGAAPAETENLLTKPIEDAVGVIKNVRLVRSVSRSTQSDVILEFLWGTDMDIAGIEVREKLDIVKLPLEAGRPVLLRFDPSSEPIVRIGLLRNSTENEPARKLDYESGLKALRRIAEDQIKTNLESVTGTAAVKISGGLEDEIQIQVDQQKLAQLNLSIKQVAQKIRSDNVNLSGGRLEQGTQRFVVRTINEFKSVEDFGEAIVANVGSRSVYLKDIAQVKWGFKEREAITRVNGRESVELAIYKEGDANTVQVARQINENIEELRKTLPDELELISIYDQSTFISAAIDEVISAAIIGGVLAIIVLFGFLQNSRATIIIGLAIPVSVIGTFLLMFSADITLNIMSLGGIALAVGMLVDNAIVVLENIVRKKEQGENVLNAARNGTIGVAGAVTASTLTTIAVFFPMVFISGIAGQLFRDQALTVTFALVFSLIVALTLIPMMAALGTEHRFKDASDDTTPGVFTRSAARILWVFGLSYRGIAWFLQALMWIPSRLIQRLYRAASDIYPLILAWALRRRLNVVVAAISLFALTMSLVPRLGTELIPQLSQGEISVALRLPPGSPLNLTDMAVQAAQKAAANIDSVVLSYSVAGTGNRLDANPVDAGENSGTLSINMGRNTNKEQEDLLISRMRQELSILPGVQFEFSRPSLFSFSSPLQIEIAGYDLDNLTLASQKIIDSLSASGRFTDIRTTVKLGNPEVNILFNQERAANLGLSVREIADSVVANVRGELATRYSWRDKKIDVLVRGVDSREASPDDVRQLIVNPESGRPVTLEAVADIGISTGPAEIRRISQERVAIVNANLSYGALGAAAEEAQAILDQLKLPPGIVAMVAGQNEEMQQSFLSMQFALLLAIFLVYLVMASQFESLIQPLAILFTIPLALVGAVLALFATGSTINVVAFIGVIMLAGIVVNNAIVLIDLINQLREKGMEITLAIMEAGQSRLRPIMMTTLTTVLGLMPMAIGIGEGSELRSPLAITVIGGLLVSTLLTLVVIPVMYSLMDSGRNVSLLEDSQPAGPINN